MKFTALILLLVSSFSHAVELDATEALLSTLKPGVYTGMTPVEKKDCSLTVENTPQGVLVTARAEGVEVSRSVGYGTVYRWNPGQRLFLSSDNFYREDVSEEIAFRTIAIDDATQFAVVSYTRTIGRDRVFKNEVSCEINL